MPHQCLFIFLPAERSLQGHWSWVPAARLPPENEQGTQDFKGLMSRMTQFEKVGHSFSSQIRNIPHSLPFLFIFGLLLFWRFSILEIY